MLLTLKDLSIGYNGRNILDKINLTVDQGDYICILGDNGAGKSTLMKTILGLIPPTDGDIGFSSSCKQTEIGYLPQQTDVQRDFPASVYEITISGCLNRCGFRPFYNKEEKLLAVKNLEKLGMSGFSKKCYRELSGGQQQRVLLARALCATQKILLLDEPVAGLDPQSTKDMYSLLKDLNEKDGIAIIMISHDIKTAIKEAKKVLYISSTNIFFGSKEEYVETYENFERSL